ncbi:MAG: undecaprenyl/decaprenyl-phosphate alpha-N-acetylglucosaminyl 1-phosphate transferase [Candidatus Omnitrophica bacterium]|nr:undecaprenyl/decaprenyl-phosphate alpha-N-acetylglucosaminyl 1-phosphate transferase [Candidatus Omnitrophota bacterium]
MFSRFSHYFVVFLVALVISWFITPVIANLAKRLRVLDVPEKNKLHKKATPRLGGIAIFVAYFISLLVTKNLNSNCGVIIVGGMSVLLLGTLDDVFKVPAVIKFIFITILTFFLVKQGILVSLFGKLFFLNFLLTLLWIVGVTSAFNAVDNMDGLAGGLGAIAAITFFIIALRTSQWEWATLAIALCGALLGFLRYNFSPAKIFMGDSGSLFLGFTLALIGIKGEWSTNSIKASIIPILVLGVPIFDLAYIVIRRWTEGTAKGVIKAITFCAKDHLSHRLLSLGYKQRVSVLFIYLIAICVSIGAIVLQNAAKGDAVLLFFQFILIFITIIILISITKKIKL